MSLTAGVLPHLFDPDVSPPLLLLFGRVQRPRGRRPERDTHTQTHYKLLVVWSLLLFIYLSDQRRILGTDENFVLKVCHS